MSDDYQSVIASLIQVRDTILADLAVTAADLAALTATPTFTESGDGGSESIDVVGLRRQLMDEIKAKNEQIREISVTLASLQAGINVVRIPRRARSCRLLM